MKNAPATLVATAVTLTSALSQASLNSDLSLFSAGMEDPESPKIVASTVRDAIGTQCRNWSSSDPFTDQKGISHFNVFPSTPERLRCIMVAIENIRSRLKLVRLRSHLVHPKSYDPFISVTADYRPQSKRHRSQARGRD